VIEIGLSRVDHLETQTFQWCLLRVAHARLDFAFPIRMPDVARQWRCSIMLKHIAVERVQCGIVGIGFEYALARIVEDDDFRGSAQPVSVI
jgi:hypothetical protein